VRNAARWVKLSVVVESAGVVMVAGGIGVELATSEPLGVILITAGSLTVAVGSGLLVKARRVFKS